MGVAFEAVVDVTSEVLVGLYDGKVCEVFYGVAVNWIIEFVKNDSGFGCIDFHVVVGCPSVEDM